ncbi:MAG: thioredoxin family protein [Acidimicrobiales bacterium]
MVVRVAMTALLVAAIAVSPWLYRRRRARLQEGPAVHPPVPADLLAGAERTWLLFTTPWCASCGPVEDRLRQSDPEARVVKVDATVEPVLAGTFSVRSAPTALLADADGRVHARLVGAAAVEEYVLAGSVDDL